MKVFSGCVAALLAASLCAFFVPDGIARPTPGDDSSTRQPPVASDQTATLTIPGPLRSFLRMAAISQKASPDEVTSLLARNVFALGYEGPEPKGRPTEYLILLSRYVQQAKELAALAGPQGVIQIANCEQARPVLKVLGYRTRPDCGKAGSYLETADPQRAFLTIDSGFPLPVLEKSLQQGKAFTYAFPLTRVPALTTESDWARKGSRQDLVDTLISDQGFARFYWALSRLDGQTQAVLKQSQNVKRALPYAAILDFYGTHIRVRNGRVIVPGGEAAESGWKDLVGVSPGNPAEFILRLISKDNGWLAAYFDSLSRVSPGQQAHFANARQLRRYFEALRGKDASPDAGRGVFRHDAGLLLLVTRVRWEPDGNPHVPGNLDVWKKILQRKSDSKIINQWGRRARHWKNSDQLLEAMFAFARVQTETGPLQAYLMLSELDARRPKERRLGPDTVAMLASMFSDFSDQYLVFSEFPELDDGSMVAFVHAATGLNRISQSSTRGNALGTFQAVTGLWQILARQGQIPRAELNRSWQRVIKPYEKVVTSAQVFDAGRSSLKELLLASAGRAGASQDEIINLLAGPPQIGVEGQRMHDWLANRIRAVLDEQRLVSLDTILSLGDGLHDIAQVKSHSSTLLPLAGELREFQMPQPIFRSSEREQWAAGIYNNHHTEGQMRTDLTKVIKSPNSARQIEEARGQLASFFRDTLVGLNYAYYEPPGAQILHHNPLFVRSHDFSGETVIGLERIWQAPHLFGAGSPAGGGGHLVGSLADLPYVLSKAEQDFITPENVQALIWRELVPALLTNAIVPRWWSVSRTELHAVALYQQSGEDLVRAASTDEALRNNVMQILSERMAPRHADRLEEILRPGASADALVQLSPSDTFYLGAEYRRRFPEQSSSIGAAGKEFAGLAQQHADEVNWDRLSRDFGVPHPVLAQSCARELLNLAPFPAFMGYSSRLLAESWDSNNLYWARLADEKGYPPVMLNVLVPQLTRRMIEKIFATDFEDWPALLRATRETGEEFREGKIGLSSTSAAAALR